MRFCSVSAARRPSFAAIGDVDLIDLVMMEIVLKFIEEQRETLFTCDVVEPIVTSPQRDITFPGHDNDVRGHVMREERKISCRFEHA